MNGTETRRSTENGFVGWVPEDSNRGTWSLITSCLFTITICTWTAIHPRIHVSRQLRHQHKFYQLVKAVLAPEMVYLESLQEFLQARKAVRRCAATTNNEFKTVHGFYLCMMGVRYNSGHNGVYRTLWPGQYAWLLNNGLVSWQDHKRWGLAREEIADKNKADGPVNLAALLQVTMTLAFVFNGLVTYAFWLEKPKDIVTASFVSLPEMTPLQWGKFESLTMENTYGVSDPSKKQDSSIAWYVVPRDCRDDEIEPTVTEVKADNVITEWDSSLYMTRYWPLLCLLGASFGAIHLISWTSSFPSEAERWLWRVSALVSVITSVVCMRFRKMSLTWNGPLTIIKATSFRYLVAGNSHKDFKATGIDSMLAGPFPREDANGPVWSILTCVIDGDEAKHIVLGNAEFQAPNIDFKCLVFQQDILQARDTMTMGTWRCCSINSIRLLTYDMARDELLAQHETSGRLMYTRDVFGRIIEARMQSKVTRTLSTTANEFLLKWHVVSSHFQKLLSRKCILDPVQQYAYGVFKSSAGNSYLASSTLSYFNDICIGRNSVLNVVDCVGQKRTQQSRASPGLTGTIKWHQWLSAVLGAVLGAGAIALTATTGGAAVSPAAAAAEARSAEASLALLTLLVIVMNEVQSSGVATVLVNAAMLWGQWLHQPTW
ncbi:hypothetical protein FMUND_13996 [Fusarium mundagurra]|uniref:Transmembrane protein n=1 Tax=Fusarium mundagurra TaxID=1567541 RepID=A0A8H5XWK5_9HYPO|nr:hypothetical protein FMUND_13996 [Fusarium mundagurra]